MTLPRTPLWKPLRTRLVALNDQLQFFFFTEHYFLADLPSLASGREASFTSAILPDNPYSKRLHVRLAKLAAFQVRNQGFTLGAYFSATYEVAASIFGQSMALLATCSSLAIPLGIREGPEELFWRALKAGGRSVPLEAVRDTFTYCRHRRNTFIHLSAAPSKAFADFCAANGATLNVYWAGARGALSFSTPAVAPLDRDESITLIKLLRIATQQVDQHVASLLSDAEAARYAAVELFGKERVRINSEVTNRRVRKLRAKVRRDFGSDLSDTVLTHEVRRVGVR